MLNLIPISPDHSGDEEYGAEASTEPGRARRKRALQTKVRVCAGYACDMNKNQSEVRSMCGKLCCFGTVRFSAVLNIDSVDTGHLLFGQKNEKGESLLHKACIDGNLRRVKTLVEKVGA